MKDHDHADLICVLYGLQRNYRLSDYIYTKNTVLSILFCCFIYE